MNYSSNSSTSWNYSSNSSTSWNYSSNSSTSWNYSSTSLNYSSTTLNYSSNILLDFNSTNYVRSVDHLDVSSDVKSWLMGFVKILYESDLEERYSKPMVWIGRYITLASLCCVLAMAADLLHGIKSRKLWFPVKYFTINATSLAVIAVAMKLPVDLSGSMPGVVDQVAKLGSVAFMCIMTTNLLPSLATMDSNTMLANITAMGVLVITLVVNVCIQIHTGVVSSSNGKFSRDFGDQGVNITIPSMVGRGEYPKPLLVLFSVSYPKIAAIYVTMLLVLLIILVSSSLAIQKSKQIIEFKYQQLHEDASKCVQQPTDELSTVEKLEQHVSNYWIMAGSGSPQFIIACFTTTTASGNITGDCDSDYGTTTQLILVVQCIGVVLGTIAPLFRCFAPVSFNVTIKSIPYHIKVFKVESYWTQKLFDWKHACIPFPFRNHKRKVVTKNSKSLILDIAIKVQKGVVVICKVIALNPFFFMVCVLYCLRCLKWLLQVITCSLGKKTFNLKESPYVLQLEDEKELADRTLEGLVKSFKRLIRKSKKKQPKNLFNLINTKSTKGFQGVGMFHNNNHHVQCSSSKEEYRDCWSLVVVTLATIALSIRNLKNMEVDSLLKSVREGLDYVTLVEKNLNATDEYVISIIKMAERLWEEVDVSHKWLGIKLKDITSACQEDARMQIIQFFSDESNKISKGVGSTNGDSKFRSICANSMWRITETIMADNKESHMKAFDELISSWIADIVASSLTKLPQVIATACHTSVIEKREACVTAAAELLGETKDLIQILQDLSTKVSSMNSEDLSCTDKGHAHIGEP